MLERAVPSPPGMWPVGSKVLVPLVQDTDKARMDCGRNQPQELGQWRDNDVISTITLLVQVVVRILLKHGKCNYLAVKAPRPVSCTEPGTADS